MSTLLIIAGVAYFATLTFIVLPLCFGVTLNVWREALRQDKED